VDDAASQRNAAQLNELAENTSALSATLKRRIQTLEGQRGSGRDGQIREQHVKSLHVAIPVLIVFAPDCSCQVQVRGSYPELPDCGATVPNEIRAENWETAQNR
jgi:hypothetical protein